MAVSKTAGARFFIGPSMNIDTLKALADDEARLEFFEDIVEGDWTEVEEIESFGDVGDNTEVATFANVKDRRVRKFKTTRDAGTMTLVCGRDPLDEGQIALGEAEKTDFDYAFKLIYNDARDEGYSPSTEYFGGMVLSRPTNLGGVQDVTKVTFSIGIDTGIFADVTDPTGS